MTMNPSEDCLKHLMKRDWSKLNQVLSDNYLAEQLADSPTFSVFEQVFIDEIKQHEAETNDDTLIVVATNIFQKHIYKGSSFQLSKDAEKRLARYLFDSSPHEKYANILVDDSDAKSFLENNKKEIQDKIDTSRLSANLKIKLGSSGRLQFDKMIFNSQQELELFHAAKKVIPHSILLPNTALSTIIDSKICNLLDSKTKSFYFKSTLDLCIVNPETFKPEYFIELDSSWHDKPRQIENDKMKDEIFKTAGLVLERLRKIENKEMIEIFELYINKKYAS